ncbi:serine/threonine protein phosphatase (plasmid) [Rhodococcus erythropolis R138]|uniref:metallophosphoesterase n=1 Tax=Rhodococcus erythropolis TaxID=1833 RepID=UPI00068B0E2C|nr:metallophosphoesterase [Rhodococcus erythropolis]ALU73646.1 serine/threonine protein phosphatase [Rhodococcus erythropolis R138]
MNEIGFIGDIHGCVEELDELVTAARSRTSHLVFLGDYVNRGPYSREVIDFLIRLRQTKGISTSFVMGNHDQVFLDALVGDGFDTFLRMGGAATVLSYVGAPRADVLSQLRESVPATHIGFLKSLANQVVVDGVVATHERPGLDIDTTEDTERFQIYGHSPQRRLLPRIERDRAFIDTGCGTLPDGRLTCLFWPSLTWIQSKPCKPIR